MDCRRPFRSSNEHRYLLHRHRPMRLPHASRLKKRRAEASCEVPAKHAATEEMVAEHLQQLYIDPAHGAQLAPCGFCPWWQGQQEDAAGGKFLATRSRTEDDEMTAIMSQPHQAVPYIRLTPPTPVQSDHVRALPPKWQVVLEDLDGEDSGEEVESEGEGELTVELSPEVHQHLRNSTSQLLTASRLRSPPCLAVVPWTPPNYFIARVLAMSESQSAPDQTPQHSNSQESMES